MQGTNQSLSPTAHEHRHTGNAASASASPEADAVVFAAAAGSAAGGGFPVRMIPTARNVEALFNGMGKPASPSQGSLQQSAFSAREHGSIGISTAEVAPGVSDR